MSFVDILFYLVIFPIQQLIDVCYYLTMHFLGIKNPAFALIGVSAAVSLCTLPIYLRAESWQLKERETQKKMSAKIAKINQVFKGDERYMIMQTYYRQNNYHPVYAFRNSLGVLIQIPFFIAAYHYISHINTLQGISFLAIRDLSAPDSMLNIGNFGVNILPILMTLINIVSGAVWTKGLPVKDKAQVYAMAAIFLVLLYNSPAGLVLYWTANNIFSLIKNIIEASKNPKKLIKYGLCILLILIDVYLLFFHGGYLPKRIITAAIVTFILCAMPFVIRKTKLFFIQERFLLFRVYLFSCLILFLLSGLVIPSSLIASSVEDFAFAGSVVRPFPFIVVCALQSAGFFLIWTMVFYFLFPNKIKQLLTFLLITLAFLATVNVFFVKVNYGFLANTMIFSDAKPLRQEKLFSVLMSIFFCVVAAAAVFIFYAKKKRAVFYLLLPVTSASLLFYGIFNIVNIERNFVLERSKRADVGVSYDKIFNFSKDKNNVLFIMMDAAVGAFVPYIFYEKPELLDNFSGFTWYPNTAGYAVYTLVGALTAYGGYEYSPLEINKRKDAPLLQKQKEAYLVLPTLFADAGYDATVVDPPFTNFRLSNLGIFEDDKRINAIKTSGKYTQHWLDDHKDIHTIDITEMIKEKLIRFSFFKMSPLLLRAFIYDGGDYIYVKYNFGVQSSKNTDELINSYALLDTVPSLTSFDSDKNTFISFYTPLSHAMSFLQAPDYVPAENVTNFGDGGGGGFTE